jgi:hypothetical protein
MAATFVLTSALVVALGSAAVAQTLPETAAAPSAAAPAARPMSTRGAVYALRGAYRAIADAQVYGGSAYLDAAKTHYRNALARYQRQDAGAASEAMASLALARAAVAEHPAPVPRDLPAPPADVAAAPGGRPMMGGRPQMRGAQRGGPMRGRMGWRFDATQLAADAKLANTAEARDLAQKAVDADVARTRASFTGNPDEAMRQGRLAASLAMAVRSLAYADHPPSFDRRMPWPGHQRPAATSTLGNTSD